MESLNRKYLPQDAQEWFYRLSLDVQKAYLKVPNLELLHMMNRHGGMEGTYIPKESSHRIFTLGCLLIGGLIASLVIDRLAKSYFFS